MDGAGGSAMRSAIGRKLLIAFGVATLAAMISTSVASTNAMAFGADFAGPGPEITGNNTGGIFPYRPAIPGTYDEIAEGFCARYGRLGKVTSIHRSYGDYVSFVCYDRTGRIH
jgi:hypothetical protein